MPTYVLPERPVYRENHYYPAGTPFDLPAGIQPPKGSVAIQPAIPEGYVPMSVDASANDPEKPKRRKSNPVEVEPESDNPFSQ
jgi:hypothetical protein